MDDLRFEYYITVPAEYGPLDSVNDACGALESGSSILVVAITGDGHNTASIGIRPANGGVCYRSILTGLDMPFTSHRTAIEMVCDELRHIVLTKQKNANLSGCSD